ncbi:MAG: Activator of Hsp90 ATPase 1 family protein [Gemmatimonadetes bacterium]|nr:Activator of Hsp90 ATPase 1 family protein [Gemmatimonadota bacterium]
MYATIDRTAGATTLRFDRRLPHPSADVWAALAESGERAKWLAPGEIELRDGGRVLLAFADGGTVIDSTVTAVDPGRLLEFGWTSAKEDGGPVRWELSDADGGGTRLVLTCTLPPETNAAKTAAAWHMHLEMLDRALAGEPAAWSMPRFTELRAHYMAAGG